MIVVRREGKLQWTNGDAAVLKEFMQGTTWRKFERLSEDSVLCDLMPEADGTVKDMRVVEPFASGRMRQILFMYAHANLTRSPMDVVGERKDETETAAEEPEKIENWPIQLSEK
jgi:hypothetical protein